MYVSRGEMQLPWYDCHLLIFKRNDVTLFTIIKAFKGWSAKGEQTEVTWSAENRQKLLGVLCTPVGGSS